MPCVSCYNVPYSVVLVNALAIRYDLSQRLNPNIVPVVLIGIAAMDTTTSSILLCFDLFSIV
jgi:hypothetical protein